MYQLPKRKTKIVATLGPASASPETIREMIKAGMNVVRLNFSHGSHEEHTRTLELVRAQAKELGRPIGVFQDLCGPKVRIGPVENGEIHLDTGKTILLKHFSGKDAVGSPDTLYVEAFDPVKVIQPGEKALLADGRIALIAARVLKDAVECSIAAGGPLRSRSGIAVPDSLLDLPALTEKDKRDIAWAAANKVDYVALSFVGSEDDIRLTRATLAGCGAPDIPVIAKIERAKSLDHISSIVEAADAVMVARGDLGLELPLAKVPAIQRLIIHTANACGTPVITATQMLSSMVHEIRPTRAEVSDVSTAVRDGTDAVMLSEETAIGDYPVEAVRTLAQIVEEAEDELSYERTGIAPKRSGSSSVADAVCFAACNAGDKLSASAMIACTLSGFTARLMSKYRPLEPLFGVTPDPKSLAHMSLYWGVEPVLLETSASLTMEEEINQAMKAIHEQYGVKHGSRVVITAGLRAGKRGTTNVMQIREIPWD